MKEKIVLKDLMLYGGVNKENYEKIKDEINQYNRFMVNMVLIIATILVTILFVVINALKLEWYNPMILCVVGGISIAILLTSLLLSEKYPRITGVLIHSSYVIFYAFGMVVAITLDPDSKSVTFIALLVLLPILFMEPPIRKLIITTVCEAIFVFLCIETKTGTVLLKDIVNTLLYGFLGSTSGVLITYMLTRSFVNEHRLQELGRADRLTGMNNRNAYELDFYEIPKSCRKSLACVYVDANGLKMMNDSRGHKYGDKMLSTIAGNILELFGEQHAYRVGGDEFIIFIPDVKNHTIDNLVSTLKADVEASGYNVAIGWDNQKLNELSLNDLTKNAEVSMYKDKSAFYKKAENERRRRN